MRITKNNLTIRVMRESDYSCMAKWLNCELVLEYYGPRLTLEQVIDKYGPRLNKEHYVTACIVEYSGASIGFIQYYVIPKEQLKVYLLKLKEISGANECFRKAMDLRVRKGDESLIESTQNALNYIQRHGGLE